MRLIDANKVEIGFDELCQSPYFKNDVNAKHGAETLMDLCVRSDSHKPNTIDPETLPIVQELRKELERVTAERDAAISDLYYVCACETCELQYTDKCPLKKGMVPCSHIASALINNTPYKWRGIQEAQEDEQL